MIFLDLKEVDENCELDTTSEDFPEFDEFGNKVELDGTYLDEIAQIGMLSDAQLFGDDDMISLQKSVETSKF